MGNLCSSDDSANASPIDWRTPPVYGSLSQHGNLLKLLEMRLDMTEQLTLFMNTLHENEEAGYRVLKRKRKEHLAKRYTSFHPHAVQNDADDGNEEVKEGLFEGEEEAERKVMEKEEEETESGSFAIAGEAEPTTVPKEKLSDMQELQTMFAVACALGKLTDARDIFELGIKKLQRKHKEEARHEVTAENNNNNHRYQRQQQQAFDINKPLNCFHRPDFEHTELVRWTPLQLAIASFSSTGPFLAESRVDKLRQDRAKCNQEVLAAYHRYDKGLRKNPSGLFETIILRGSSRRLSFGALRDDYHNAFLEKEGVLDNFGFFDVWHTQFEVPADIQEANKRRLADFVEFLLSEGADPNGNPKETSCFRDELGRRNLLESKHDFTSARSDKVVEGNLQQKVQLNNNLLHEDHPLFLAIRGTGGAIQTRTPNELVIAELATQNETTVDPLQTQMSALSKYTYKTPLYVLCEHSYNGKNGIADDKNNNSDNNPPPRAQAVSVLLARGADKQFVSINKFGKHQNPLNAAMEKGNTELIALLQANGCTPEIDPEEGEFDKKRRSTLLARRLRR